MRPATLQQKSPENTQRLSAEQNFSLFYAFVVAAPIVAGVLSTRAGTAGIAFDFGAFMLAGCFPAYWAFRRFAARAGRAPVLAKIGGQAE